MSRANRANRAIGKITGVSIVDEHGIHTESFADDPITPREGDKLSIAIKRDGDVVLHVDTPGGPVSKVHNPRTDAWWNAIARAWFVDVGGEAVRLDPQPPAPGVGGVPVSPRIDL